MTPSSSPTEGRNPRTAQLDAVSAPEQLELIMREDAVAVDAALTAVPDVARLVEATLDRLRRGGRVRYAGAGASGRLAVLDATESVPTFGVDPDLIQAHFPGGAPALVDSTIDLEDASDQGRMDLRGVTERDVVVGVTASGATAYVRGALESASDTGALTALITSNPGSSLAQLAEISVVIDTGAEALTGSTRLKAGTATKVVLNAFSTAIMTRLGRTWSNLMVGLLATNDKLRQRSVELLVEATGEPQESCRTMLSECSGELPLALVRLLSGATLADAERALEHGGSVRTALRHLESRTQ